MKSKTLPGISESVAFINACAGKRLVRARHRLDLTSTSIDFLVLMPPSQVGITPMNYALTALWRKLGTQTRIVSLRDNDAVMFYEWNFAPPAGKLRLILMKDGRTVIRLSAQVTERRRAGRSTDRRG